MQQRRIRINPFRWKERTFLLLFFPKRGKLLQKGLMSSELVLKYSIFIENVRFSKASRSEGAGKCDQKVEKLYIVKTNKQTNKTLS